MDSNYQISQAAESLLVTFGALGALDYLVQIIRGKDDIVKWDQDLPATTASVLTHGKPLYEKDGVTPANHKARLIIKSLYALYGMGGLVLLARYVQQRATTPAPATSWFGTSFSL